MRTTTKVIYKPDSQSTDEFIVIVGDADALTKWRDGVRGRDAAAGADATRTRRERCAAARR